MHRLKSISLHLRLLLLGLTLLSVLSLDKREVAIYLKNPAKSESVKSGPEHFILKEKVSFEAVTSFIVLPEAIFPALFRFHFAPLPATKTFIVFAVPVTAGTFRRLLVTAISPNAP